MLIQERFKSPDKVFEKVYGIFDKRDYFNTLGLAKVQIRNFENFLKKGDKNAQALLDKFKGDNKKAHEYIIQVIHDRQKEQAFEDFKAFKSAVNKLELVSKGKSKEAYGAADLVKSRAHNNSQKYTMALYSAIRKQKFNNYKDIHKDVDDLLAKNEGFSSDAQRKAAFANGYEEKGKKKNESVNEAIKYNKDGFVTKLENEAGKVVKDIQIDGEKFVLKGNKYVSKKGGKDLHKSHFGIKESVNENRFLDALKDFFRKEEPTFGQMAKRYKKKSDFIKWFVKSQAKQGVVFKKDGYGAYMMNRMGRIWDRVHGQPEDKKYVGESVNEAMRPSQVRSAISKVKKGLMRKWKQKGGYENFGQKELSQMKDKFDYNPYGSSDERQISKMLDGFDDWAMNYDGNMREGKKRFKRQDGIGKAKYTISYHDGKKKHKDGSDFFDIKIFKNKKDLSDFVGSLVKQGYKLTNESVNESASKEAMGIAALTGTRGSAVQDFIDKNRINSRKLFNALKKANLQGRINFASALAGKPNNPNARLTKKLFGEDKKEIVALRKKAKSEKAFYDVLDKIEKKYGRRGFEKWLDKSLKDLKINPSKLKTSADKQEALFQAKL